MDKTQGIWRIENCRHSMRAIFSKIKIEAVRTTGFASSRSLRQLELHGRKGAQRTRLPDDANPVVLLDDDGLRAHHASQHCLLLALRVVRIFVGSEGAHGQLEGLVCKHGQQRLRGMEKEGADLQPARRSLHSALLCI